MESLLLAPFHKLPGLSKGCRNRSDHYSRDRFSTQASLLTSQSTGRGGQAKCPLRYVCERTGSRGGRDRKWEANAASEPHLEAEPDTQNDSSSISTSVQRTVDAFYRFSRPHTMIGTALSVVSVSLLAVENITDLSAVFFTSVLEAVVAALCMNIYMVGLNQLSDIEIDKVTVSPLEIRWLITSTVNKPYLPLASGEYSFGTGAFIVSTSSILSFLIAWIVGSWPLFWALFLGFVLGTGYSVHLPLLRWKRFAVGAATCILAFRAVILPLAYFLHIKTHVFQRPPVFPRTLMFVTAFMSFFSVVIALFKDIPDIEGDETFGIRSFTVQLGQKRVFWICIALLEMAYAGAILFGSMFPNHWSKSTMVIGDAVLASVLWVRARSLDLGSRAAITSFYLFIWKLFYAEYLLIPLIK